MIKKILLSIFSLSLVWQVSGQNLDSLKQAADTNDVNTIDGIINAYHETLSGKAGSKDWNRFRTLFLPGAQINAVNYKKDGNAKVRYGSMEEYIKNVSPFFSRNSYYEDEYDRLYEFYAHTASVVSNYYTATYFNNGEDLIQGKGIAFFQLIYFKQRWWIVNVQWNTEKPGTPLPELNKKKTDN